MNKSLIAGIFLILLVGIAGAGYYLTQGIDGFVKTMIERVGSDTTKTAVNVQEVKISLANGSGQLGGLTIANPTGFSQANLFTMSDISIAIDTASLTRDVHVIKEITVTEPIILVEQAGTKTNLQALMSGMDSQTAASAESTETTSNKPSDIRIAVNEINFLSGKVLLKSDILGERTLTLPSIALRDIGSSEQGLAPEALGQAIAAQLIGQIRDAVSKELKALARKEAERKLKEKLGESAAEGINKLKGLFGN
jgi:hypothetical protein